MSSSPLYHRVSALIFLLLALVAAMLANLCLGEVNYSPMAALETLCGSTAAVAEGNAILMQIRLPRLLTAALVGLALSLSGYLLQKLSRNYLADPYLTGVSSGAAVAVAAAILLGIDLALVPVFALTGGALASALVIFLSRAGSSYSSAGRSGGAGISIPRLLLSGIALSSISSAAINLVLHVFANQSMSQGLSLWLLGGVAGRNWSELIPTSLYVLLGFVAALACTKQLKLLSLGEEGAASLGLDVEKSQLVILAAAVLLAAGAVSLSGLVGFVGLIGPHLARRLVPTSGKCQLLAAALCGAIITLAADLAARTLLGGQELPLGSLMAVVGGPIFIYLLAGSLDKVVDK